MCCIFGMVSQIIGFLVGLFIGTLLILSIIWAVGFVLNPNSEQPSNSTDTNSTGPDDPLAGGEPDMGSSSGGKPDMMGPSPGGDPHMMGPPPGGDPDIMGPPPRDEVSPRMWNFEGRRNFIDSTSLPSQLTRLNEAPLMSHNCSGVENPVCGSNLKTYYNLCEFRQAKEHSNEYLYIIYDGPCWGWPSKPTTTETSTTYKSTHYRYA